MANSLGLSNYSDTSKGSSWTIPHLQLDFRVAPASEPYGLVVLMWRGSTTVKEVKYGAVVLSVHTNVGSDLKVTVYQFTPVAGRALFTAEFNANPTWADLFVVTGFAAHQSTTIEDVNSGANVTSLGVTATDGATVLEFYSSTASSAAPGAGQTSMLFDPNNLRNRIDSVAISGDCYGASYKTNVSAGTVNMTRGQTGAMVVLSIRASGNTIVHPTTFYVSPSGGDNAAATAGDPCSLASIIGALGDNVRFLRGDEVVTLSGKKIVAAAGTYTRTPAITASSIWPSSIFGVSGKTVLVEADYAGCVVDGADGNGLKRVWGNGAYAAYNAAFSNNQYSRVTFKAASVAPTQAGIAGCGCRMSGDRRQFTGYVAEFDSGAGVMRLWKYVNQQLGLAGTQLGSDAATSFNVGDTLEVRANGTTIELRKNGATVISVTDSSIASGVAGPAVKHTLETTSNGTAGYIDWSLWEGGDLDGALNAYSDNFTRANNVSLGANWTEQEDSTDIMQIVSNALRLFLPDKGSIYNGVRVGNTGEYVIWRGFEFKSSSTETRTVTKDDGRQPPGLSRPQGLNINLGGAYEHCVIHDLISGMDKDNERGLQVPLQCLVYNIGWISGVSGNGSGHAAYWENKTDGEAVTMKQCVCGPCFGFTQIYGAGSGANHDVTLQQSVWLSQRLVWGGNQNIVSDDGLLDRCFLYRTDLDAAFANTGKQDYEIRGGYFWRQKINAHYWDRVKIGDVLANAPQVIRSVHVLSTRSLGAGPHAITYMDIWSANASHQMFERYTGGGPGGDEKFNETLSDFKSATGHLSGISDGDLHAGLPSTSVHVFPSTVDVRRGLIVIWNTGGQSSVVVDMSSFGWNNDAQYRLRQAMDPYNTEVKSGNIQTGTLSLQTITVQTAAANYSVAKPTGHGSSLGTLSAPDVLVFLVEQTSPGITPDQPWYARRLRHQV